MPSPITCASSNMSRRATVTTFRTYQSGLNSFLRWLTENGHANASAFDFNVSTLRRYLYFHSERGLRPRTLRGRFHPIKALATFLVNNGAMQADPTKAITLPKKDLAQRLTVSTEEVCALLDACERVADLQRVAMYRVVLSVLIFGGLRRQECLDLCVADYDAGEGCLIVQHGKGNKRRTVYLCDQARQSLDEWVVLRPKGSSLDWLFLLDRSRRVGQDALANLLEEVKAIAGLWGATNTAVLRYSQKAAALDCMKLL